MCYTFRVPEKRNGESLSHTTDRVKRGGNQEGHMDREDYDRFYKVCEASLLVIVLTGWALTIVLGSL